MENTGSSEEYSIFSQNRRWRKIASEMSWKLLQSVHFDKYEPKNALGMLGRLISKKYNIYYSLHFQISGSRDEKNPWFATPSSGCPLLLSHENQGFWRFLRDIFKIFQGFSSSFKVWNHHEFHSFVMHGMHLSWGYVWSFSDLYTETVSLSTL